MAKGEVALAAVAGVEEASINLSTSTATVTLTSESNCTGCAQFFRASNIVLTVVL